MDGPRAARRATRTAQVRASLIESTTGSRVGCPSSELRLVPRSPGRKLATSPRPPTAHVPIAASERAFGKGACELEDERSAVGGRARGGEERGEGIVVEALREDKGGKGGEGNEVGRTDGNASR